MLRLHLIRGPHIMFCNLDELMTFSFHATKCPVNVTGLLPAVLTFAKGFSSYDVTMTTARENLLKSAFKVYNIVLEINLRPEPLFSGGLDRSCLEQERWKTTVVVEWQQPLPQKTSLR